MGCGGDIGDWFKDEVVDPIGDALEDAVDDVVGLFLPDLPPIPTWDSDVDVVHDNYNEPPANTIEEGGIIPLVFGKCAVGGNIIRVSDPWDYTDIRLIVAYARGEISGVTEHKINDILFADLEGFPTKTDYKGTGTQTYDVRFELAGKAQAYRHVAYTAYRFSKNEQISSAPKCIQVIEGLLCPTLANPNVLAYTRNPAVIAVYCLYKLDKRPWADIDIAEFQVLETYCNAVPSGGTAHRYSFDYVFSTKASVGDIKRLVCKSFSGNIVESLGKLKPVWEKSRTSVYDFNDDNIIQGTFKNWGAPKERPNVVSLTYKDSSDDYKTVPVELKNNESIEINGEIPFNEKCLWITDKEVAQRKCQQLFDKIKYVNASCVLSSGFSSAKLEEYDRVTVTNSLAGYTLKDFIITKKVYGSNGICTFSLSAYYSGIYHEREWEAQENYAVVLPNPYIPLPVTSVSLVEGGNVKSDGSYTPFVTLFFTLPIDVTFWDYVEVFVSTDNVSYRHIGNAKISEYIINAITGDFDSGDTVYVKLVSVNKQTGAKQTMPTTFDASVVLVGNTGVPANLLDFAYTFPSVDIIFTWTNPTSADFAGVELRDNTSFGTIDSHCLYRGMATTFTLKNVSSANPGTYYIKSYNRYGTYSAAYAQVTPVNAVPDMPSGLTYDFAGKDLKIYWDNSAAVDHDYYSLTLNSGTAKEVKDNTYIYTFDENVTQNTNADPTIQIALRDVDLFGQQSSPNNTTGTNPAPSQPTNLDIVPWATGIGVNWDKGSETDLLKHQYRTRVSSASWSDWIDETGCSFVRQLTQSEMDTYGAAAYISVEVRAVDWFLQTSSAAAGGDTCLTISEIQLAGAIFQIAPSDSYSRPVATLKNLYNGDYTTAAASYLTGSWVEFAFPVDYVFSGVNLWNVDISPGHIYFAYSQNGTAWSYIKAESDHTLDSANKLLVASNQSDAQTNYWAAPVGKCSAYFPGHVQARYVRMYCYGLGINLAELKFNTLVIADEIICFTLSSIVANLGDVNIGNVSGGDGSVTCYNSSAQKTIEMTTAGNLSTFRASTGAEICRLGNLNGFLGYTSATDGIAIGDSDDFFKYDLTNGVRMSCGSGGSLKILSGGDITLEGHSTNPGRINFEGSTYTAAMGLNATGTLFEIIPVTDNVLGLQIGNILGGWPITAARRFTGITMASRNHVALAATDTAAGGYPYAGLTLYSGSSTEHAIMDIGISGSSYGKYGWYYDSYRPGTDSKLLLGTSTYRWKECHADCYYSAGGWNAARLKTRDATNYQLSFAWNGTTMTFFINGASVGGVNPT